MLGMVERRESVDDGSTVAVRERVTGIGPAVVGDEVAVLASTVLSAVQLAVWRRPLPPGLAWLSQLDWSRIDDLAFETPVASLAAEVAEGIAEAGYPAGVGAAALVDEIVGHARRFAAILRLEAVAIRLEVIETDACRKFHADHVTARLLTTLLGAGTQWVRADAGPDAPVHQLRTGDVGIFKGRLAADSLSILHRSPPIAAAGETRLLLAIDPA